MAVATFVKASTRPPTSRVNLNLQPYLWQSSKHFNSRPKRTWTFVTGLQKRLTIKEVTLPFLAANWSCPLRTTHLPLPPWTITYPRPHPWPPRSWLWNPLKNLMSHLLPCLASNQKTIIPNLIGMLFIFANKKKKNSWNCYILHSVE